MTLVDELAGARQTTSQLMSGECTELNPHPPAERAPLEAPPEGRPEALPEDPTECAAGGQKYAIFGLISHSKSMNNRPGLSLVLIAKQFFVYVRLSLSDFIGMHQKHGHAVPVRRSLTGVTYCRGGTFRRRRRPKYVFVLSSFHTQKV